MNDERKALFREWLEGLTGREGALSATAVTRYIREISEVEDAEGNLDEIFKQVGLRTLWNEYHYTEEQAINDWGVLAVDGSENPTRMRMHPALLLAELRKYRSRIKEYSTFLGDPLDPE